VKIETHILYPTDISQNYAVYEITWKNIAESEATNNNTVRSRRVSYWVKNEKYTQPE